MKMKNIPLLLTLSVFIFTSCSKDETVTEQNLTSTETGEETAVAEDLEIEEFVYDGLNEIYLYKADVPVLADNYFNNSAEKSDFLADYSSPEDLFDNLLSSQDRFSFISDNYKELEDSFDGISSSTAGMKFGLGRISGTNNIFAFLQYIIPGTSADEAGLTRGTVFTEVDGQKLTLNNFSSLLDSGTFTINIGYVENGVLVLTDKTATLTHSKYTANPVQLVKTIDMDGTKIGYLMYNSFIDDFDDELNSAFAQLKSEGVTELVLDLRYNGGGSVESAVDLASMITGQFEGQIFMKEQWNEKYQNYFEKNDPESLINRFNKTIRTGETINSLNLSRVYILTTNASASASELVINGLAPYIDVVQVGETTTGKFQASVTLYDSDDFGKEGASKNHTYAIQPLVLKSANAQGKSDYVDGLTPDVSKNEDISNLGILGEPTEPLLEAALNHIFGRAQKAPTAQQKRAEENFKRVGESGMFEPGYQKMYLDKVPEILRRN
ncbi:peptidase S41 [Salinimicrobium sp. CDJ15-81-2]|nr:peptidase S41 [Salinimicrobium nanhaiense]